MLRIRVRTDRSDAGFVGCRRGNASIIFGLSAVALAMVGGLGLTAAQGGALESALQDQADALALNAAVAVRDGAGRAELNTLQARTAEAVRGVSPGSASAGAEILARQPADVLAEVSASFSPPFGGLFGRDSIRVTRSARAIAGNPDPICLLVLAADAPAALARRGVSSIEAPGCVAQVNSSAPGALDSDGVGVVSTLRTLVHAAGRPGRGFRPAPVFGASRVADPYAGAIEWPAAPACAGGATRLRREARTFAPGVHCGGFDLGPGAEVTLLPGVHVLAGDLAMSAGSSLTGVGGVTIVLVGEDARLEVRAGADLTLESPGSGPWAGLALAVNPQRTERTSEIIGGAGFDLTGAVYMPTQRLFVTGGGDLATPTDRMRMLVTHRLETRGNGRIFLNGRDSPAEAGGAVRLVE